MTITTNFTLPDRVASLAFDGLAVDAERRLKVISLSDKEIVLDLGDGLMSTLQVDVEPDDVEYFQPNALLYFDAANKLTQVVPPPVQVVKSSKELAGCMQELPRRF